MEEDQLLNNEVHEVRNENNQNSKEKNKKEEEEIYGNRDAFHEANIFSRIFFGWTYKFLGHSKEEKISHRDLGVINDENSTKNFLKSFMDIWVAKKYNQIETYGLLKATLRYFMSKGFSAINNLKT